MQGTTPPTLLRAAARRPRARGDPGRASCAGGERSPAGDRRAADRAAARRERRRDRPRWPARASCSSSSKRPRCDRVINATGVIVHTNLGRAPLAARAPGRRVAASPRATRTSSSTSRRGERGSRHAHVEALLRELTGAEAAIVVNNGAAAVLLAVAALAGAGRAVVVSRGQLVEIGGGFRIPEVVAQSGRATGRGGDDQPHASAGLPAGDRQVGERARRDPARASVELPHGGVRRGGRRSRRCAGSACR